MSPPGKWMFYDSIEPNRDWVKYSDAQKYIVYNRYVRVLVNPRLAKSTMIAVAPATRYAMQGQRLLSGIVERETMDLILYDSA